MKPPGARLTVSRMMLAVAIVCLALAIVVEDRRQMQHVRSMMAARNACGAARLDLKQREERLGGLLKILADARARREQLLAGKAEHRTGDEFRTRHVTTYDVVQHANQGIESLDSDIRVYEGLIRAEEVLLPEARARAAAAGAAFDRARSTVYWPLRQY